MGVPTEIDTVFRKIYADAAVEYSRLSELWAERASYKNGKLYVQPTTDYKVLPRLIDYTTAAWYQLPAEMPTNARQNLCRVLALWSFWYHERAALRIRPTFNKGLIITDPLLIERVYWALRGAGVPTHTTEGGIIKPFTNIETFMSEWDHKLTIVNMVGLPSNLVDNVRQLLDSFSVEVPVRRAPVILYMNKNQTDKEMNRHRGASFIC